MEAPLCEESIGRKQLLPPHSSRSNTQCWASKYAPITTAELALNRSKLSELRYFLYPYRSIRHNCGGSTVKKANSSKSFKKFEPIDYTSRLDAGGKASLDAAADAGKAPEIICVLEGPSGCGKQTSIKLLSNELGIQVVEWNAISDANGTAGRRHASSESFRPYRNALEDNQDTSLGEQFLQFLNQALLHTILPLQQLPRKIYTESASIQMKAWEGSRINHAGMPLLSSPQASTKRVNLLPRSAGNFNGQIPVPDGLSHSSTSYFYRNSPLVASQLSPASVRTPVAASSPKVLEPASMSFQNRPNCNQHHLVLVQDLPATLLQHSPTFSVRLHALLSSLLSRYSINPARRGRASSPLVICVGDSYESQKLLRQFMPLGTLEHPAVRTIKFSAFTPAAIRKVLLSIVQKEGFALETLRRANIDINTIVEQCNGDLRYALNSLEFALIGIERNYECNRTPRAIEKVTKTKSKKRTTMEIYAKPNDTAGDSSHNEWISQYDGYTTEGKDEVWSIYHSAGKFLWNKRIPIAAIPTSGAACSHEAAHSVKSVTKTSSTTPKPEGTTNHSIVSQEKVIIYRPPKLPNLNRLAENGENKSGIKNFVAPQSPTESTHSQMVATEAYALNEEEVHSLLEVFENQSKIHDRRENVRSNRQWESIGFNKNKMLFSKNKESNSFSSNISDDLLIAPMSQKSSSLEFLQGLSKSNPKPLHLFNHHANLIFESVFEDSWGWACHLPYEVCMFGLQECKTSSSNSSYQVAEVENMSASQSLVPKQFNVDSLFPKTTRPKLYFSPEATIEQTPCDLSAFVELLHHNYLHFFGNVTDVASAASHLAFCDAYFGLTTGSTGNVTFSNPQTLYDCKLWYFCSVVARSILDCNLHPLNPTLDGKFAISKSPCAEANKKTKSNLLFRKQFLNSFSHETVEILSRPNFPAALAQFSSKVCFTEVFPTLHKLLSITRGTYIGMNQLYSVQFMNFLVNLNKIFDGHSDNKDFVMPQCLNKSMEKNVARVEKNGLSPAGVHQSVCLAHNEIFEEALRYLDSENSTYFENTAPQFKLGRDASVDDIEETD